MGLKAILTNLFYISKLSIQSLSLMVKAKYKRRRAKATFQRTLILHGIPSEAAQELAKAYPNPINEVLNLMNMRRIRGKDWRYFRFYLEFAMTLLFSTFFQPKFRGALHPDLFVLYASFHSFLCLNYTFLPVDLFRLPRIATNFRALSEAASRTRLMSHMVGPSSTPPTPYNPRFMAFSKGWSTLNQTPHPPFSSQAYLHLGQKPFL